MSDSYSPSPATKSGRPLKPDAIPGAIVDYLNAYRLAKQVLGYSTGGGWRSSGGNMQRDSSGNCGQHSLWWWGSDILDTGTPPGGHAPTAPAPLTNMLNIYPKYNIIFDRGTAYYVSASNGVAQGERKPIPCTEFNHGSGFGFGFSIGTPVSGSQMSQEAIDAKLAYRKLWQTANWAANAFDAMLAGYSTKDPEGFARGGSGGSNYGGQRMINATIAGKSQRIAIDTGTDAILGGGNGNKQCVFPPNPQAISVPSVAHWQASYMYVPTWSISHAIKICLTNEYTICQSYGQGGTITYNWQSGEKQNGDPLNGRAWGESNTSTTDGGAHLRAQTQPQQRQGHDSGYYYQGPTGHYY